MKIAFFNLYSGINNRGAETFSDELASRLSQKNKIILLKADEKTWVVQPEHNATILKRFFIDSASLSVLLFSLKQLPRLWKEKPDVVIPMNGFWQVLLCKLIGAKIVIVGHSGPGWDERWNLYLHPNVFIATTGPTEIWAKSVCPWTKVEVIPYGIDLKKFATAKPIKLDLEKPIILCPAAAVPYKRIELAIAAVSKLETGSLLHLGAGPEKEKLLNLGNTLLGSKRFKTQSVLNSEMPGYYSACSVVTLPSAPQENSPIVFLESIAAGKPLVVTDSPRARWILEEAAIYVNPQNIEEYSQAIQTAIQRKDSKKILAQAEKYSWKKIGQQYENLINNL